MTNLDLSPISFGSMCLILLQEQMTAEAAGGWLDFANKLTVPAVLFLGIYFLYKMNQKAEEKRDENMSKLVEKLDKANEERDKLHIEEKKSLRESLKDSEDERKDLQRQLIEQNKK